MSTEDINDVGSSWRRVIRILEQDERVSPRQRGFVVLTQPQGLIGNTLLVAVPNELTREVLQNQLHTALSNALSQVFSEEISCAVSVNADLVPPSKEEEPVPAPAPSRSENITRAEPVEHISKPSPMLPSTSQEFGRLNPKYVFFFFLITILVTLVFLYEVFSS